MAAMQISFKANFRDESGRFTKIVDTEKRRALEAVAREGASAAGEAAATHFYKYATGTLVSRIFGRVDGNVARVISYDEKTMLLIEGATPHTIVGNRFFAPFWWVREGRRWVPGYKLRPPRRTPDIVNHPGFEGYDFLEPGYEAMANSVDDWVSYYMSI